MELIIRDARTEDIPALEALEQECFSMPWTGEQLIAQLPDGSHRFLVAEREGTLLGYVGMMFVLDEGYISNVATAPEARRQGVGRALITALLEEADKLELSFVTLEVRRSNEPAKALYAQQGFLPVGERRDYYQRPKEDAILMTKFLK